MEYNKQREFENDQRNIFQTDLQNNMNMFLQQIPNILNQQHPLPPVFNHNAPYQVPNTFQHSQFMQQNLLASQQAPQGESFTIPQRFPNNYESFYSHEPNNIVNNMGQQKTAVLLQPTTPQLNPTRMVLVQQQIPVATPRTQTISRPQSNKNEPTKQKKCISSNPIIVDLRPDSSYTPSIRPISNQMEMKQPTNYQQKNVMNTHYSFDDIIEETDD